MVEFRGIIMSSGVNRHNLCDFSTSLGGKLLIILIILYAAKGVMYPEGTISVIISLIEMLICSWYFFLVLVKKRFSNVSLFLSIICLIILFSYLISPKSIYGNILGNISTFAFFRSFCGAVLPFFPFYYLSSSGKLNMEDLKKMGIVLFFLSILYFFYSINVVIVEEGSSNYTINAAYKFLYITPLLSLIRKKWLFISMFSILFSLTILGSKRGAIIGMIIQLSIYFYYLFKDSNHKLFISLIIIILVILFSIGIYDFYQSDVFFQQRVEATLEGSTSGRDKLISNLISHLNAKSIFNLIFGSGFIATVKAIGNYAHNDWMEILYDFGIIGLISYLLFFVFSFYKISAKTLPFRLSYTMGVNAIFFSSFFSMAFFSEATYPVFIVMGSVLGYSKYMEKSLIYPRRKLWFNKNISIYK